MITKKYIVAGNYEEYKAYIRKKIDINTEFIYVDNPNKIRGLSDIEGYYIGTYNSRTDIDNIKEIIRITKYTRKVNKPVIKQEIEYTVALSALNSVYGNVTQQTIKADDYWRINSDIENY